MLSGQFVIPDMPLWDTDYFKLFNFKKQKRKNL